MGLDTVELIIAIEDEFDLQIPDEDASYMESVGDIHLYIVKTLSISKENEAEVWEKLKAIVVRQLGVSPKQVTKQARIVKDLGAD